MLINANISNSIKFTLNLSTGAAKSSNASASKNSVSKNTSSNLGTSSASSNEIDALIKQKEKIKNAKQEFRTSAAETGLEDKDITTQLATYDEQIRIIDQKINEIKKREQEEKLNNDNEKIKEKQDKANDNNSRNSDKNNISESIENNDSNALMDNLIQNSSYLDKSKQINDIFNKTKSSKRILDSEIKTDEGRGVDCTKLREESAKLSDTIENIQDNLYDTLKKSVDSLTPNKSKKDVSNNDTNISSKAHSIEKSHLDDISEEKNKIQKYVDKLKENESKNENTLNYTV